MDKQIRVLVNALDLDKSNLIEKILQAALDAADPYAAVCRNIRREGDNIIVGGNRYQPGRRGRVFVYGFGKASLAMARAINDMLSGQIHSGAVITKHVPEINQVGYMEVLKGDHPLPGEDSLASTRKMHMLIPEDMSEDDLVICLISGGGSALCVLPPPGIYLEELQETTRQLMACGASIHEINTIRKHLDLMKGGGFWVKIQPAQSVTMVLSDVVGDNIDVIASGPMTPDPTTFEDVWEILKRYNLDVSLPPRVTSYLRARLDDHFYETLKPASYHPERSQVIVIGSNKIAGEAAVRQAQITGFHAELITTSLTGEARLVGAALADEVGSIRVRGTKPACKVFGGETTVTLKGEGIGGRNLEAALGAVSGLAGQVDTILVTLATDGEDGSSGAAGAVVTGESQARAVKAGLDPVDFLERNDSFGFFDKLGDLIITGPTGTNVNDLTFLFTF